MVVPNFLSGKSFLQPPLDTLYASSFLKNNGYEVRLIDNRVENYPLKALVERFHEFDIIVVSTCPYDVSQNYFVDYRIHHAIKTVNEFKEKNPEIPIIICGPHGSVRPDLMFKESKADIVVRGEYEKLLPRIIDALSEGKPLEKIPNIVVRKNGRLVFTQINQELLHPRIDYFPLPDYSLIKFRSYFGDIYVDNKPMRKWNWAVILAQRGCPFNCLFCFKFFGNRIRQRSPESIVREMSILENEHGLDTCFFLDYNFTMHEKWVINLCRLMRKSGVNLRWMVQTRCDKISRDVLKEMQKSGCFHIWLGIESFSSRIQKMLRKYENSACIYQAIKKIRETEISVGGFIMLGAPGETIDILAKTIRSISKLKLIYTKSIIVATPLYGTDYYELAKKEYPSIGNSWDDIMAIRGLVANSIKPRHILTAIDILSRREYISKDDDVRRLLCETCTTKTQYLGKA